MSYPTVRSRRMTAAHGELEAGQPTAGLGPAGVTGVDHAEVVATVDLEKLDRPSVLSGRADVVATVCDRHPLVVSSMDDQELRTGQRRMDRRTQPARREVRVTHEQLGRPFAKAFLATAFKIGDRGESRDCIHGSAGQEREVPTR